MTAAGPAATSSSDELVDAINQVFALFRLNYHNQFYAAWPDGSQLNQAKKLWLEALADYPVVQILSGARHALETCEYVPTLNRMLDCCQQSLREFGLTDARSAYLEACRAASPKSAQAWSHAAVYLAGRDSDWFFLANNSEAATWPIFRGKYNEYCRKAMSGAILQVPDPQALPDGGSRPSTREEALAELARLKGKLAAASPET
jgi:hypothetical protein